MLELLLSPRARITSTVGIGIWSWYRYSVFSSVFCSCRFGIRYRYFEIPRYSVFDIGISEILVENRKVLVPHLYLAPLLRMIPSEFRGDVGTHKTKMNGLSCGYRVVKKA